MAITVDQAIEATRSIFVDIEDPHRLVATIRDENLWTVNAVDEHGRPWPGTLVVVGEDLRVWPFSSNPNIHDPDTVFAALSGIYAAGVASFVDPELLAERIELATVEIHAQHRAIIAEAEAGSLRPHVRRRLP